MYDFENKRVGLIEAVTSTKDLFKEMEGKQVKIIPDAPPALKAKLNKNDKI